MNSISSDAAFAVVLILHDDDENTAAEAASADEIVPFRLLITFSLIDLFNKVYYQT